LRAQLGAAIALDTPAIRAPAKAIPKYPLFFILIAPVYTLFSEANMSLFLSDVPG
jgi:hypothetical protein